MKARTLTARSLLSLPPGDWTDSTVEGLTLRVRASGSRVWALRYRAKRGAGRGPQRRLHFGGVGGPVTLDLAALELGGFVAPSALTLEAARDVARALLGLAARGVDPQEALASADRARRKREAEAESRRQYGTLTVGLLLDRFLTDRADGLRPATRENWARLAANTLGPLRDRDPATLTAREVRAFHRAIGASGHKVTANRALELLSVTYAWAMKREDEKTGEPLLIASPCVGVEPFEETARTRVLSADELRDVWRALDGEVYADAFKLLLWTGARRSEVLGMELREVDLKARLWTVPAERSKTGSPRKIPLSTPAAAMLLARMEADPKGRWVFRSPRAAVGPVRSLQAPLARVQQRSGVTGWSVHDLRRTTRTGLAALGVSPAVAEWTLGHLAPKRERVYNRYEPIFEALAALEAWAVRLASFVSGEERRADVLPMVRR